MSKKVKAISHKIELVVNNKIKTYFRKAFGCSRLAYNYGLSRWKENYEKGIKMSILDIKKEFNAIKKEKFDFVYDVTKYATQQPFIHLERAATKFFKDLKKGKVSYPKFKKKSYTSGSFYIGGDAIRLEMRGDKQYLHIPNLGFVKMTEVLRYEGHINSVTITQEGDKFYASFSVKQENVNKKVEENDLVDSDNIVGIDLGILLFAVLSDGTIYEAPKQLKKLLKRLKKLQRQLSKRQHPKTKSEVLTVKKSNNYIKLQKKVKKLYMKIKSIREDFLHKVTTEIVNKYDVIVIEDLNVSGMMKNHKLARSLSDVSFSKFKILLQYKAEMLGKKVIIADRFFASSKTCSNCGNKKEGLKLSERTYKCEACGLEIDRDLNASINLKNYIG